MSSVSGDTNSSSVSYFLPSSSSLTKVTVKPTTEPQEVTTLNQDDRLSSPENSRKASQGLTNISTPDVSHNQDNGSLKVNLTLQTSEGTSNSTEQNSNEVRNGISVKGSSSSVGASKVCRFFQQHGRCKYGSNCRYIHPTKDKPRFTKPKTYVRQYSNTPLNDGHAETPTVDKAKQARSKGLEKNVPLCKFFSKGGCFWGLSCRYSHQVTERVDSQINSNPETALNGATENKEKIIEAPEFEHSKLEQSLPAENKPREPRVCRFYSKHGYCNYGASCKFYHDEPDEGRKAFNTENLQENIADEQKGDTDKEAERAYSTQNCEDLQERSNNQQKSDKLRNKRKSDMTLQDFSKLRKTEINQLKRRFPKCTENVLPEVGSVFEICFSPSDPDWRFDVKSVTLNVMIPELYPLENMQVDILNPEGILPDKLIRYFYKTTFNWLEEQHEINDRKDEVKLLFRPFLKWLDKSLEDIFIAGLKMVKREMEAAAAGIQFVTHQELNERAKAQENKKPATSEKNSEPYEEPPSDFAEYDDPTPDYCYDINTSINSQAVLMENVVDKRSVMETPKRGTEIKLRNLEFLDSAATMTMCKLCITVQCGRCKMRNDVAVSTHRSHRIECERCHHQQKLIFRPQMMHQFSTIAGYLDLDNCQVVDIPLLTCEFAMQCLPCGRQNLVSGIQYAQRHSTWCMFCNSKMSTIVESVKLNQLQPNTEVVESKPGQVLKLEKKEKRVKDPAIQEGKPLPENGTCKHYKKSFRWLRFPCCGKAYPCDVCHDEKETDHDMKLANRMICGYCAKEQPFSKDRPCVSCSSDMTKKAGAHWEGGKGCRDKIKMSKDDRQKYAGCNKTISRKLQPATKKEK